MQGIVIAAALTAVGIIVIGAIAWFVVQHLRKGSDPLAPKHATTTTVSRSSTVGVTGDANAVDLFKELPPEFRSLIDKARASQDFTSATSSSKITINTDGEGREVDNMADVPPELRKRIEEAMHGRGPGQVSQKIRLNINGRHYEFNSIDEVPEDLRKYLPPHLFG